MVGDVIQCAVCQAEVRLEHGGTRRYCSRECALVAQREHDALLRQKARESTSTLPPNTMPETVQPAKSLYTATCSQCGETTDLALTAAEVRALKQRRCWRCGGRELLDHAMLSSRDMTRYGMIKPW